MRVILLASGDLWAGAEVSVYQLACGLKKLKSAEPLVVLFNYGRLSEELLSAGIEVHVVDEEQLSFLRLAKKTQKIIQDFSPHIIHSHRYKENLLAWLVTRVKQKIRLIATQHGMPETSKEKNMYKDKFRSALFFYLLSLGFQKTVVVSQEMRSLLLGKYGFSERKLEVIQNGIILPPKIVEPKSDILCVGSAGRLFPVKGYDLFVEIAVRVVNQNKQIQFVLAGDGPERPRLERAIAQHGLQDSFTLLGHVDNMANFYKCLDVYVNTSVHEGIPMSILEAMGYGLPVVAPYAGGFPEIINDGECGYLVTERDPDMFAQKILKLGNLEQRKKMAYNARKRVEQSFSLKAMTEKYYQLYNQLLSKG